MSISTSIFAARFRRPVAVLAGALMALTAGAGAAGAAPTAPAGGGHCPATQISKVWYGGHQDSWSYDLCGDLVQQIGELQWSFPGHTLSTASRHSFNKDVVFVELALRSKIYVPVGVDGFYGPNTARAVRIFQVDNGLFVDGKVGPETWRHLFASDH